MPNPFDFGLDPIGAMSMTDPMSGLPMTAAPAGAQAIPAAAPPATDYNMAPDLNQPVVGFNPSVPMLQAPTMSQKLIAAGLAMIEADKKGLGLGGSLASGMNAYNQQLDDYRLKSRAQRMQDLAEYQLMASIRDRQTAELAKLKRNKAIERLKKEYPDMADLIDADPEKAGELLAKKFAPPKYENVGGQLYKIEDGKDPVLVGANGMTDGGATGDLMRGEEYLKTLNPTFQAQVKAVAEGRAELPSSRSPLYKQLLDAVAQYDPSFDTINYKARAGTRKAFTSGVEGRQANALNTVIGHVGSLYDQIDGLDNTDYQAVNIVKNLWKEQTGDPKITNFQTNAKAVADEVVKVWRASGGSVHDIEEAQKALKSSQSPAQLKGALSTLVELLNSKLGALNEQYKAGMGTAAQAGGILTKESLGTLKKMGLSMEPHGDDAEHEAETMPAQPKPAPTQAQLEYTAKKYGMTVEQVKQKLGIQ